MTPEETKRDVIDAIIEQERKKGNPVLTFPKISRQFLIIFPKYIDIRPKEIDIVLK